MKNVSKKNKMNVGKISFTIISFLLLAGVVGCEKEQHTDPPQIILGQWELISYGGSPITPTGFIEFLPSGIVRDYDYDQKHYTSECKYSIINDSVMLMCDMRHEYHFFEDKMLLLPLDVFFVRDPTAIYRRKK